MMSVTLQQYNALEEHFRKKEFDTKNITVLNYVIHMNRSV